MREKAATWLRRGQEGPGVSGCTVKEKKRWKKRMVVVVEEEEEKRGDGVGDNHLLRRSRGPLGW